jgi:outer membrane protein assembly factor BamB
MQERNGRPLLRALLLGVAPAIISVACCSGAANAAGIAITSENRVYRLPMPAADQFLYPISDITSKYVAGIGHRGTRFTADEMNAYIFDAVTGEHLWTFTQPVPDDNVNFRFSSIAIDGDLAVVGAEFAHVPIPGGGVAFNAGALFVYDLTTGQLKHKLVSETPQLNRLGYSVDILGNIIAASDRDAAYLFDAQSGEQLVRLDSTASPGIELGGQVALSESAVVVGARTVISPGQFTGAMVTFDVNTFAELSTYQPTGITPAEGFGNQLAVDGRYGIASGNSGARVFDIFTGEEQQMLTLPGGPVNFPHRVAIDGTMALLGNPVLERAMAFDWTTGATVQDFVPSDPSPELEFGYDISLAGKSALVGGVGGLYQYDVVPEPTSWALMLIGVTVLRRVNPVVHASD